MSETNYSEVINGDSTNHDRNVKFDATDGYIGITSTVEYGVVTDRILLTPAQAKRLVEWLKTNG